MNDKRTLEWIRRMSYILDNAIPIPGTKYRIGLDPLLGLIPGVGDAITSLMSTVVILSAMQMNVSRWTLTRMVFNILMESIVGIVPIVGDIFDAFWKSNERNRILLEKSLQDNNTRAADRSFVVAMVLIVLLVLSLTGWATLALLQWLVAQF